MLTANEVATDGSQVPTMRGVAEADSSDSIAGACNTGGATTVISSFDASLLTRPEALVTLAVTS